MVFPRWAFKHVSPGPGLAGASQAPPAPGLARTGRHSGECEDFLWLLPEPGEDSRCFVCRTFKEGAARVLRREGRVLGGWVPDPALGRLLPTPSRLGSCPAGPPGQTPDHTAPALGHRTRAEPLALRSLPPTACRQGGGRGRTGPGSLLSPPRATHFCCSGSRPLSG